MSSILRLYYVPLDALAVTTDADQDIWQIAAPAGEQAVLHGFELTSQRTTEEGTDNRARLRLMRRSTAGTGGSSITPSPVNSADDASSMTVSTLVTAPGTAGAILGGWYWSQQNSLLFLPPPEGRIVIPKSGLLCLNLQSALAGTRNWSGWVAFEEG